MNEALGLLLPAAYVIWTLAIHRYRSRVAPASIRLSAMIALVMLCTALTAATEALSLFHAISFWPILSFWFLIIVAAVPLLRGSQQAAILRIKRITPQSRMEWALAGTTLTLIFFIFVCGRLFPPQTYDTLSYHLPRQVIWWQQQSVEHFDSGKYRNLSMPPFSEYIGLHLMVLTSDDFWHTGVQWLFMLVGIGAATRLVRQAGGSRNAQWLAALFIVTFPAAYLEASSAKNDLVLGAFMIIFLAFALMPEPTLGRAWHATLLGLSLGLAILTKGTAYIFMLPIVLWYLWRLVKTQHAKSILLLGLVLFSVLALNIGHAIRNQRTFGNAVDRSRSEADVVMINESHTPARMISVISRNIISLSVTPIDAINQPLEGAIKSLHDMLKLPMDDPATSYEPFYLTASRFFKEERAASILHNVFILAAIVTAIVQFRRGSKLATGLIICIVAGFLIFSLYMKWQPWHVRLFLPLLFIAGPLIALTLPGQKKLRSLFYASTGAILVLSLCPFLFAGPRPLFAAETWTKSRTAMRDPTDQMRIVEGARVFAQIIDATPDIKRIAIASMDVDEADYVMMKALLDSAKRKPLFSYMNPIIKAPQNPAPPADAVIALSDQLHIIDKETGKRFAVLVHVPPYSLYQAAKLPDLSDVPVIVQGAIIGVAPFGKEGLGAAVIQVESVLRGPSDLQQVRVMTYSTQFYNRNRASSARPIPDNRGIWLLKPAAVQGCYFIPSGQYLLPDTELALIRKILD